MRKFREALDARIASFTSAQLPQEELDAFPEVEHVITARGRLSDWYAWAPESSRKEIEAAAAKSDLLSCHVMLRYHAHWVRRMAKRHDIPYWFVPHGQMDPWVYTYRAVVKKLWLALFGKRLMREAAHVIYSTEQEREKAKWFYDGPNARVIHWPVELIDTEGKAAARESLHQAHEIPMQDRVLLYIGRIHSMKNPLKTIEALAQSKEASVHLLIVGPDGDVSAAQCLSKARELGVADRVHVPGPLYGEEKTRALLGSDAFISLSHRENFGHTAAESIAAATPVILSPGNDLGPELKPYQCGWFLEDDRMETAVAGIRAFAAEKDDELELMGQRGREFVAEKLSFELFQSKLKALAEEAVAGHGA
jgi:glycosyltransferase involved in cell wall biosynthesis